MIKIYLTAIILTFSGVVNAAAIDSLEITGGSFVMAGAGGTILPGAYADMTVGGYDGSASVDPANTIGTFNFGFFGHVGIYTAKTDGVNSGFAPVSGDITGGDLTLDLSSWIAGWKGDAHIMHQGSSSALAPGSVCVEVEGVQNCSTAITTTYDDMTGTFTATWSAVVIGGAFNGQVGTWNIEGNVSAVPVPAAVWLFGSGLVGLVAVAHRRKAA